jgi:hypothetical protein
MNDMWKWRRKSIGFRPAFPGRHTGSLIKTLSSRLRAVAGSMPPQGQFFSKFANDFALSQMPSAIFLDTILHHH